MRSSDQPADKQRAVAVPYPLRLTTTYLWRLLLIVGSIYVLLRLLNYFTTLVVPFAIAILLTAFINPAVNWASRYLPRAVASIGAVLLTIAVISGLFTLIGSQISSQFGELSKQALEGFKQLQTWLANGPLHLGSTEVNRYLTQALDALQANSSKVADRAVTATATAGEILTGMVLVLFTMIFLLLDGRAIWSWALRFVPVHGRERADAAGQAGWVSLSAYVKATLLVALVDALGIGIGAAILGVPLAIPLGVLVFVGAFIPIVGALVSGAVAVLVALVALGFVKALIMLAIVIGVQQVESHVLQPFLMGRMVSIHPLGVVFAIGAGIIVDGITGALFAVPLVAVLKAVTKVLGSPAPVETAEEIVQQEGDTLQESDTLQEGDTLDQNSTED